MKRIVGRDRELGRVAAFLAGAPGACLVIQGEAGLGKTTIWRQGVELARASGSAVLVTRPLELDIDVPFSGLQDLLGGVLDELLEALPDPQRRALETALQRADPVGAAPEWSTIAFALHRALETLARRGPVLIAIDDLQWLDEPSAVALRFAAHRLDSAAVRMLAAQRIEEPGAAALGLERVFHPERFESVVLGPLSVGSIQYILKQELSVQYPRPLLLKIHETSGGNPFFALELARAVGRHGGDFVPGRPLPVPQTLSALVQDRLAVLPSQALRGLEVAALLSDPTLALARAAVDLELDLRPAINAGLIALDRDRIHFAHPLIASAAVAAIGDERRRELHSKLAQLVDDPESQARHMALGVSGEDPAVAAALEDAARLATARGAPVAGAELLEQALMRTPEGASGERARRLLATANANHLAGDPDRALELALQGLALVPPGHDRARALVLIGDIDGRIAELEEGVDEAGDDLLLRAQVQLQLAANCFARDLREAVHHARRAAVDAKAIGDEGLLAQALAMQSWFEGASLTGDPERTAQRGAELEQDAELDVKGDFTYAFTRATFAMWRDDHGVARHWFEVMRRRAVERGRVFDQAHALLNLAQVEWRAGSWDRADEHIEDASSLWPRGDLAARSLTLWMSAVVAAHRGDLDASRAAAEEGLAAAGDHVVLRARNLWVLGFIALCADQVDEALARLGEAADLFDRARALEPGMRLFTGDLLDAYMTAGQVTHAEALAGELLLQGAALGRPRATVIGGRGRGLVLATRGELEGALDVLTVAAAAGWAVPLEQGRTLLALGAIQRRVRRRREARATFERALELFEELGAPIFAERARAELGRIAGRTPSGTTLTPAEQRIAELVAHGRTNREVAEELVLAVHTVEAALTRIYSKLGVRSRTDLARRMTNGLDGGGSDD